MPEEVSTTTKAILQELASEIRSNIHELKRCFVIEFMGLPKSGKTTIIKLLSHYLRRNEINCHIVLERASICPIKGKQRIEFSIWNACSSLIKLLEAQQEPQKRVIIFDRGIFDSLAWMKTLSDHNGIRNEEYESIYSFFTNSRWIRYIDLLIHLKTTVEQSLKRENDDVLIEKPGSIMNYEILTKYQENAVYLVHSFKKIAKDFQEYDTTTSDTKDNARKIVVNVLRKIKELSDEEIATFPYERTNNFGVIKRLQIVSGNEAISFLKTIESEQSFIRRSIAEDTPEVIQIVAATIIENDKEIVIFQKYEKKSTQRFHLKNTLWAGGHLRHEDISGDIVSSLKKCVRRELREEISYEYNLSDRDLTLIGLVYDPVSEKSRRHLGVIFSIGTLDERLKNRIDGKNISEKTGQSHFIEIVNKSEIFHNPERKFENWSLSIASNYLGIPIDVQLENQLELF